AAQARVVRDYYTLLDVVVARAREQAQEHGLAGLQRADGVQPHGRLRADAADEPFDRAVAEHDRGVAGTDARRLGRAHDRRGDERHAGGEQLFHPLDKMAHWAGLPFPRIASQTRDGVHGMSTWRTPRASQIALTIAGGEPTVADSPIPLAPI